MVWWFSEFDGQNPKKNRPHLFAFSTRFRRNVMAVACPTWTAREYRIWNEGDQAASRKDGVGSEAVIGGKASDS